MAPADGPSASPTEGDLLAYQGLAAVVVLVIALVYLIRERQRRAELRRDRQQLTGPTPRQGSWSTGVFGTWDRFLPEWRTCLPSFLFPGIQTALNQAEIEDRDVSPADVCVNLYYPMVVTNVYRDRQAIRTQFGFPHEPCEDLLCSLCCTPCAVAQNSREIEARLPHQQQDTTQYTILLPSGQGPSPSAPPIPTQRPTSVAGPTKTI